MFITQFRFVQLITQDYLVSRLLLTSAEAWIMAKATQAQQAVGGTCGNIEEKT